MSNTRLQRLALAVTWAGLTTALAQEPAPAATNAPPPFLEAPPVAVTNEPGSAADTNAWLIEEAAVPPSLIDRSQSALSDYLLRSSESLDRYLDRLLTEKDKRRSEVYDRFFGDRRIEDQETRGTRLRVSPGIGYVHDDGIDYDFRFSGRINLPRLEDRLQLVVDNLQDDEDVLLGIHDGFDRRDGTDDDPDRTVALRYRALDLMQSVLDLDVGLRFRPAPVPKVRLRGRVSPGWDWWNVRFYQSVFWDDDDGFGEKTELRTRRDLSRKWFVTSSTAALRAQESDGFEFGQTLNLGYVASSRAAWIFKTGASAHTEPRTEMEEYSLRLAYERRVHSNWAFIEIEPGADFPRDRDFDFTPQIKFKLKLLFGDID